MIYNKMKQLTHYLNENITPYMVFEAWGINKNYKNELEKLFDNVDKKLAKNTNRLSKSRFSPRQNKSAYDVLSKYPMQILIDKAGYEPKTIIKRTYKGDKTEKDKTDYGKFIYDKVKSGEFSKEDLIKWWEEWETNTAKAKFFDPKYLVKLIDPTKMWDPYNPSSTWQFDRLIKDPSLMFNYIKNSGLSYNERKEVIKFLGEPTNLPAIQKAIKSFIKTAEKSRPSFSTAALNYVQVILDDIKYDKKDIKKLLQKEYDSKNASMYAGNNYRDCEGSAIVSIVLKALNSIYNFEIVNYGLTKEDNDDWYEDVKIQTTIKRDTSEDLLKKFVEDAPSISVEVKDLGVAKSDSSAVSSSSFTTFYKHNFQVIIKIDSKIVFDGKFENVTVGTDYYSGGW